jgi:hypothetical protein
MAWFFDQRLCPSGRHWQAEMVGSSRATYGGRLSIPFLPAILKGQDFSRQLENPLAISQEVNHNNVNFQIANTPPRNPHRFECAGDITYLAIITTNPSVYLPLVRTRLSSDQECTSGTVVQSWPSTVILRCVSNIETHMAELYQQEISGITASYTSHASVP